MNPLDRFRLDGRRVLVTGGTKGIGLAICRALAGVGAARVLVNSEEAEETAAPVLADLRADFPGTEFTFLGQDLAAPEAGTKLAEAAGPEGVDVLVLCAGVQLDKIWTEATTRDFDIQVAVNLRSSLELLQALVSPMEARGWGRVIVISSIQAHRPAKSMMVYAATKAALGNIVKNLARISGPRGVTVNSISPGFIDTPRNAKVMSDEEYLRDVPRWVPVGRPGEAFEVANVALLLASEAGAYINGADYAVDGGIGS
jgi:NAD(P)-dependent dehydrogenase (short-subunit alcohol dehydrogenase family)